MCGIIGHSKLLTQRSNILIMTLFYSSHPLANHRMKAKVFQVLILSGLLSTVVHAEENAVVPALPPTVNAEIAAIIAAKQNPVLNWSDFSNRADNVNHLYELLGNQLIWFGNDQALQHAQAAIALLQRANEEGLKPEQYEVAVLQHNLDMVKANPGLELKQIALFDTAMSIEVLRYMYDVHFGRIDPHGVDFKFNLRNKKVDLAELLKDTLLNGDLGTLNLALEPALKQYQLLKAALGKYRSLAADEQAQGFSYPLKNKQFPKLRLFLATLGDLPANAASNTEAKLSNDDLKGIKNFQTRHGLAASGNLDRATVGSLNIPVAQRVEQIILAMERLRWLPEVDKGPGILVNIPAFELWAFNSMESMDSAQMKMRVVVGEALKNQTPVLMSQIEYLDFMPHWNVPQSIVKNEIIAKLERNRNYLRNQNMEIVPNFDKNAPTQLFDVSLLEELKKGNLRIRQRPGQHNALGKVKFIFPNQYNVYLHDTQANALFHKTRRDFSHGCIRVENPSGLAEFVLQPYPKWTSAAIKKAMHQEGQQRVSLDKPLPVLIFYSTAFFDQGEQLRFYPDVYGYDTVLRHALAKPVEVADSSLYIQEAAMNVSEIQ